MHRHLFLGVPSGPQGPGGGVQKSAWIVGHSTIFIFGAVREHLGDLLVSGELLWGAFWCPGTHSEELFEHSGERFGVPGGLFGVDLSGLGPSAAPSR